MDLPLRVLRRRVDALSPAQRRALAEALGRAGEGRASERLVGFLVVDDASPLTDDTLRAFLGERLPDYAIPSRFVAVERLPRTEAGKLDRKALAHVVGTDLASRPARRGPAPPRTELEAKLVEIWRDVLKVDDIGVDDDFFEIGGDSLLSIRVIARAGREGIRISPERFFERATITHMAASADGASTRGLASAAHAPLADPVGEAPLTPIQHWFLDAIASHRDRWNQSYLLELDHALDAAHLHAVVRELVTHHAALRLRLTCRDGQWRQDFAPPDEDTPYRVVDLGVVPESKYAERVTEECEREHAALRVESGRLFRCVVFEGRGGWRRILLLGHHLVVDAVSWSVILEDVAMLVTQAAAGRRLELPERTAPARAWAIALAELAATPAVRASAAHWLTMRADGIPLPADAQREDRDDSLAGLAGCNRDAEVVTITLEPDDARVLMQEAPRRMDASAQAVLLAALLLAWRDWTGHDSLRLDLEGHGRDVLGEALDVSRTVGWFTTVFPVHLALPRGPEPGAEPRLEAVVKAVQQALDALPLRGAAHGLARYLTPDEPLRAALAAQPPSALLFNLLGTHDVTLPPASWLRVADEPQGRSRSPDAPRPYHLELNARVERGAFIISIEYSGRAYGAEAMARFAAALRDALHGITHGAFTRVALPGVDAASLAIVADLLAELDDA
jgi:non-ribosomal peptide synthase protein (TIGR01720 family)